MCKLNLFGIIKIIRMIYEKEMVHGETEHAPSVLEPPASFVQNHYNAPVQTLWSLSEAEGMRKCLKMLQDNTRSRRAFNVSTCTTSKSST